ncbi:putative nuclease HARBI1 [Photinus pyralis]|nr:putative nuclease HARBI1 [Photinus pyralis]
MLPIVHNYLGRIRRREENRRLVLERRMLRDHSNPFEIPEDRFIELYRLNRACARYLLTTINPYLEEGVYRNTVPNILKVFATLRFYASGSYQRDIGLAFNISLSQTSIHRCIHQVTQVITEVLPNNEIRFPITRPEQNRKKEAFMENYGFPGVIGCVDGTHVAILKPRVDAHNFLNRKGYYSLNVQIICDAELKILSINANYPGSNHDSFIWRQSRIRHFLLQQYHANGLRGSWLLGDSGYMLEPFLMIPFLNPAENAPESRFNVNHIRARNCVERAIGVLKCRFRVVLQERTARYEPNFVGKLVIACSALHNLCMRFRVPLLNEPFQNDEDVFLPQINIINVPPHLQRQGVDVRNEIS